MCVLSRSFGMQSKHSLACSLFYELAFQNARAHQRIDTWNPVHSYIILVPIRSVPDTHISIAYLVSSSFSDKRNTVYNFLFAVVCVCVFQQTLNCNEPTKNKKIPIHTHTMERMRGTETRTQTNTQTHKHSNSTPANCVVYDIFAARGERHNAVTIPQFNLLFLLSSSSSSPLLSFFSLSFSLPGISFCCCSLSEVLCFYFFDRKITLDKVDHTRSF